MGASEAALHVSRDQNHLVWDPAIPAVATIGSGDVVELDCLDASFGQLNAESTDANLATLDFDRVDQVNGPIAVEGAEPGDTLQIELLEFQPADWGWTASIPGFGLLADDFPEPASASRASTAVRTGWSSCPASASRSRRSAASSAWRPPTRAPLDDPARRPRRQHGHPPPDRRHDAVPAGLPAGRPLLARATATPPQGDGEVCGTAIETPMRAPLRLTVRKDLHVDGAGVPDRPDPLARATATGRTTRPTASGRT